MNNMKEQVKIPRIYIDLLDQVFEIEKKLELINEPNSIARNISKMKEVFENAFGSITETDIGLLYHNPIGEAYSETRTDLEASIAGSLTTNLVVTEVIKPIIRFRSGGVNMIARKGVVVVASKK